MGLGDSWGTREELLHPRDSHGRFRSKWKMSKSTVEKILGFLAAFNPKTFTSDQEAANYTHARGQVGKRSANRDSVVRAFMRNYSRVQAELRAGKTPPEAAKVKAAMEPLPDDVILSRVVGPEAFGLTPETLSQVEEYTGKLVADRGFGFTNLGTPMPAQPGSITMVMATPKGTRAMFPWTSPGSGSREVVLDTDMSVRVTKVDPDGKGGFYVLGVVEPNDPSKPKIMGTRAPRPTEADETDVVPRATPGAPAPQETPGDTVPQPAETPGQAPPAPNANPGTEMPAPRNEPVLKEAIGGPAVEQAPAPGAPAAPEGQVPEPATAGPVNFRQAVQEADIPVPSPGKRRTAFNAAYTKLASGKGDPGDVLRELDSDIRFHAGDQDAHADEDRKSLTSLRDLIKEKYDLGPPQQEGEKLEAEAAPQKRLRGGGGSVKRNVSTETKAAVRQSQRERGIRKETPAPAKATPVEVPSSELGRDAKTDMGKALLGLTESQLASKEVSKKAAAKRLREFADTSLAGDDKALARKVADDIDPPKMAAPAKKAAAPAAPGADGGAARKRALEDLRNAPPPVTKPATKARDDARDKLDAGESPQQVADDLRDAAAKMSRRALSNDDLLRQSDQDPDSLKSIRSSEVLNLRDLADNIAPAQGQKRAAPKTSAGSEPTLDTATIPQMRAIAEREGIEVPKKLRLKADIRKHIEDQRRGGSTPAPVKRAVPPVPASRKPSLDEIRGMKVAELRQLAKDNEIKIKATRKAEIQDEIAERLGIGEGSGSSTKVVAATREKRIQDLQTGDQVVWQPPGEEPVIGRVTKEPGRTGLFVDWKDGRKERFTRVQFRDGQKDVSNIRPASDEDIRELGAVPAVPAPVKKVAAAPKIHPKGKGKDRAARGAIQALLTNLPNKDIGREALDGLNHAELEQIAVDGDIDVPDGIDTPGLRDLLVRDLVGRNRRPTTFKQPETPKVPETPAAVKKAARTITIEDDELAGALDKATPEQLRKVASDMDVSLPEGDLSKDDILQAIFRHAAKQELDRRKAKQVRAEKRVTEKLAPATTNLSVDLDELVKDLDPTLLPGPNLDAVREDLSNPKITPAQAGRNLERSAQHRRNAAAIIYNTDPQRQSPEYIASRKLIQDQEYRVADELQKLADRLKASRRKPAAKRTGPPATGPVSGVDYSDPKLLQSGHAQDIVAALEHGDSREDIIEMYEGDGLDPGMAKLLVDETHRAWLAQRGGGAEAPKANLLAPPPVKVAKAAPVKKTTGTKLSGAQLKTLSEGDRVRVHGKETTVASVGSNGVVKFDNGSRATPWGDTEVTVLEKGSAPATKKTAAPTPLRNSGEAGIPVRSAGGPRLTDGHGQIVKRDRPNSDVPIKLPNGGNDQGAVHLDSELGALWADLYVDDQSSNSFLNEMADWIQRMAYGRNEESRSSLSEILDHLKQMQKRAPTEAVADRIDRTVEALDAPSKKVPDLPEGVPGPVRRYMEKLAEIPTAHKKGRIGPTRRNKSILEERAQLIRDIDAGKIDPLQVERMLSQRDVHESFDGGFDMWRLAEFTFGRGSSARKVIRDWIQDSWDRAHEE